MLFFASLLTFFQKIYFFEMSVFALLLYGFGSFIHLSFAFSVWNIYTRIILGAILLFFILACVVVYSIQKVKK